MTTDTDRMAMHRDFLLRREQEATTFGGPTSHWPGGNAAVVERDDSRAYQVTADEVSTGATSCPKCATLYQTVKFRLRPDAVSLGGLVPRFDDLDPDVSARLKADFMAKGTDRVNHCPRCAIMDRTPWGRVSYANITPRAIKAHELARFITASSVNKMFDETPIPTGALFKAGGLAITSEAAAAVLSAEARTESRAGSIRPVNGGIDVSSIKRGYVGRHQKGDWGAVGEYNRDLSSDERPGMLAGRLVMNARAVESGRGDVLSRYPITTTQPIGIANGSRPAGPAVLVVWTVFTRDPEDTVTRVSLE